MAIRCSLLFTLALAVPALHGQAMFEGATGFGNEVIKGKPKTVKVEREKLGASSVTLPEEESTYREDGKLSSQKRYADGKLVANEMYEYDAEGRRTSITTRDAADKVTRTQTFRRLTDQTPEAEEEIAVSDGKQQSRTIRRFDADHRVVELKSTESEPFSTTMQFEYDDRGRPREARVTMEGEIMSAHHAPPTPGGSTMRLTLAYPGDNQALITVYDGAGQILIQIEAAEDGVGNDIQRVLFEHEPQGKTVNSAKVDHADGQGNWTLKTLLERNARTQVDEPIARLHRTITYY